ncbi:MAG: sigma-70 family RNA polymerase sigma factor [Bacillota bacterium]|nr:sigma-70 family RNA polymerase sigma factor [Bacillota bacterium]
MDQLLERAKAGDRHARIAFLEAWVPFALKVAARASGRYVSPGHQEEASVALEALDEAIDAYDGSRGASFSTFAGTVIRRRLYDHWRKEKRQKEIPWSSLAVESDEGDVLWPQEEREARVRFRDEEEAVWRREEMARYEKALGRWGITLEELVALTPRHADARKRALHAARLLAEEKEWTRYVERTGRLPLKEMAADPRVGMSAKTLERQRKYILAAALIIWEGLEMLKSYLSWEETR